MVAPLVLFDQPIKPVKNCDRRADEDDYIATFGSEAVDGRRFYNIGSGRFSHPVWMNVDFSHPAYEKLTQGREFIEHDLSAKASLPIETATASLVYSSHTIEHVRDDAVAVLFDEVYRVLRPGGLARIVCPDMDLAHRAFVSRDMRYFRTFTQAGLKNGALTIPGQVKYRQDHSIQRAFTSQFARQLSHMESVDGESVEDFVDRIMAEKPLDEACDLFTRLCSDEAHKVSPGDHINWFNHDKLERMLRTAGFPTVYRSGYGQSAYVVLRNRRYFDRTRPCFSLYVEAVKA